MSPPQLGFSTAGTAKQVVSVTETRGKPLTVLKATTTSPHLQADVGARAAGKVQDNWSCDALAGCADRAPR